MNNDVLQGLVGQQVTIYSENGSAVDQGTLLAYDNGWVVLKKQSEELLYFPIVNIRLLKPVR